MASYLVNPRAVEKAKKLIGARQYVLRSWGEVQPAGPTVAGGAAPRCR